MANISQKANVWSNMEESKRTDLQLGDRRLYSTSLQLYKIGPGYNDITLNDTLPIELDILWCQLTL